MPDGDIVHVRLAPRYQKPYKQICEGRFGDSELAHEVLRPLKRDLQDFRLDESTALQKEPSQRSRGFVFMLLGAACAYLAGKMTLHIYSAVVFWRVPSELTSRHDCLLLGKHIGKEIFRFLPELESFVHIQDQRLHECLGLLTTRFPNGFEG